MADAAVSIHGGLSEKRSRAGRIGARKRWGDPGVVDLAELTAPQRRLVLALVDAAKNEKAPEEIQSPSEADAEVRRGVVDSAA
jgi:hypothetical protein